MTMTTIQSPTVTNAKTPAELFNLLKVPMNFEHLMPDSVEKFDSDQGSFLFGLKGMPEVRLLVDELVEGQSVKYVAASSKLDFSLTVRLEPAEEGTQIDFFFEGNFNPMLKMMVTKPLTSFLTELAERATRL